MPVQPFPPEGWFAGKQEILFHLKYFSFCFQVVGGLSLKLKSPFAGKKQVVIWRLAFAGGVLAPRFEWENLEGAFLQNTRVLPHLGEGVLQTWRWCPTLFLCSHERRPLELVILHQVTKSQVFILLQKGGPGGFSMKAATTVAVHPMCF